MEHDDLVCRHQFPHMRSRPRRLASRSVPATGRSRRPTSFGGPAVRIARWRRSSATEKISVPRYGGGRGDDRLEGEVATPAVLIEHAAAVEPEPAPESAASSPMDALSVVPAPESAAVRYELDRINAWIRARLLDWPLSSCLHCRRLFVAGDAWEEVASFAEIPARARFHWSCYAEWRSEREVAGRRALGLEG